MTVREALAAGSAALRAAGIESASLDASLLLAEVLNMSRSSLVAAAPQPLMAAHLESFGRLIEWRLAGESVAYILGRKEFYGLDLQVNPSVLVPRPDTETLVEAALAELQTKSPEPAPRALDLCTGSGAIAIALKYAMSAALPQLEVWAADISPEALATAQANAALHGVAAIHFCQGSLYEALPAEASASRFNLIVSNPPYVPSAEIAGLSPEVRSEPLLALDGGDDGLDLIRAIIARAPRFLCPGGSLLMEADPRQMCAIASLLEQSGFSGIRISQDLSGKERVIGGSITR